MKTQTIHSNAMGDVLNESSATGFRITDNQGRSVEMRVEDGRVIVRRGRLTIPINVMDEPAKLSGLSPSAVIMDDDDSPYSSPKDFDHGTKGNW